MRRDYFTLDVRNLGGENPDDRGIPTVTIDFDGPDEQLTDRLTDESGDVLGANDLDISYRLHGPVDDADSEGVVAVTNRVTGDFVLELNADAGDVTRFVDAARAYGKDTDDGKRYRVEVAVGGEPFATYEKSTLLVYDSEGGLLRGHSLIPSGVEL
ncbi:hypothetical protein BRC93_15630 [Halobacteriales archaeon QS_5_70_15]|jgi:hypothetical protein|nr:MAG: hypothetical protein BRC93_15630 [Halobacteriales archaeon QS_5_70_15]